MQALLDLVRRHKAGQCSGIFSVCSAHPLVIEAALREAHAGGRPVLIEATSNQVNQDGGYTGMTPAVFRDFVWNIARRVGFPKERVLLGGDHLGPNCWQSEPAEVAMRRSEVLIAQYVAAGFRKLHLDCSMSCADDRSPLADHVVAERAARLCRIAEDGWREHGGDAPVYIVGTEVPVPGGAHEELGVLQVTTATSVAHTIAAHRRAFAVAGLAAAWSRVVGLVVQPGVEFDHHKVIDYRAGRASDLSAFIESEPGLVYEAHSTDYQTPANLTALVRDHFAILKVGPAVTFALRETLWALADIELAMLGAEESSNLKQVVLEVMQAQPKHWDKHYLDASRQRFDLQFSLSDRIRYYWPNERIQGAICILRKNLERRRPALTLLSQYLPLHYAGVRDGRIPNTVHGLLLEGVAMVLRQYAQACGAGIPNEISCQR